MLDTIKSKVNEQVAKAKEFATQHPELTTAIIAAVGAVVVVIMISSVGDDEPETETETETYDHIHYITDEEDALMIKASNLVLDKDDDMLSLLASKPDY